MMKFISLLLHIWRNAKKSLFCVIIALILNFVINRFGLSILNGFFAVNIDDFITINNLNMLIILPIGLLILSPWKNFYNLPNSYSVIQIILKTLLHSLILEIFYILSLALLTSEFSVQGIIKMFEESILVILIANFLTLGRAR